MINIVRDTKWTLVFFFLFSWRIGRFGIHKSFAQDHRELSVIYMLSKLKMFLRFKTSTFCTQTSFRPYSNRKFCPSIWRLLKLQQHLRLQPRNRRLSIRNRSMRDSYWIKYWLPLKTFLLKIVYSAYHSHRFIAPQTYPHPTFTPKFSRQIQINTSWITLNPQIVRPKTHGQKLRQGFLHHNFPVGRSHEHWRVHAKFSNDLAADATGAYRVLLIARNDDRSKRFVAVHHSPSDSRPFCADGGSIGCILHVCALYDIVGCCENGTANTRC